MADRRKITGRTNEAPYGFKIDGSVRAKPGRKRKPPSPPKPKTPRKRLGPKPRPKSPRDPSRINRGASHVDRGGFRKDGTPMPATHDSKGRFTPETAREMGRKKGRPKGSFSMDRIIKDKLRELHGKSEKMVGEVLIDLLMEQAAKSPMKRLAVVRFLTERMDGKAVQPIRDVTPGLKLGHWTDEQLADLLAQKGKPPAPDPVPDHNRDDAQRSSPPTERPAEPAPHEGAPSPASPEQTKKSNAGGSGS